jgi:hypothetical protein
MWWRGKTVDGSERAWREIKGEFELDQKKKKKRNDQGVMR